MPKLSGLTKRIKCGGTAGKPCTRRARYVEYMRWSCDPKGISFFYYCATCWRTPGPYGDTPEERDDKPKTGTGP